MTSAGICNLAASHYRTQLRWDRASSVLGLRIRAHNLFIILKLRKNLPSTFACFPVNIRSHFSFSNKKKFSPMCSDLLRFFKKHCIDRNSVRIWQWQSNCRDRILRFIRNSTMKFKVERCQVWQFDINADH